MTVSETRVVLFLQNVLTAERHSWNNVSFLTCIIFIKLHTQTQNLVRMLSLYVFKIFHLDVLGIFCFVLM